MDDFLEELISESEAQERSDYPVSIFGWGALPDQHGRKRPE